MNCIGDCFVVLYCRSGTEEAMTMPRRSVILRSLVDVNHNVDHLHASRPSCHFPTPDCSPNGNPGALGCRDVSAFHLQPFKRFPCHHPQSHDWDDGDMKASLLWIMIDNAIKPVVMSLAVSTRRCMKLLSKDYYQLYQHRTPRHVR